MTQNKISVLVLILFAPVWIAGTSMSQEGDEIERAVGVARTKLDQATKKANAEFTDTITKLIEENSEAGRFEFVKRLVEDQTAFESRRSEPKSELLLEPYEQRKLELETAKRLFSNSLEQAVSDLTRAKQFEIAAKYQKQLDRLRAELNALEKSALSTQDSATAVVKGRVFEGTISYDRKRETKMSLRIVESFYCSSGKTVFVAVAIWDGEVQLRFVGEADHATFSMHSCEKMGTSPIHPVVYQGTCAGEELSGTWSSLVDRTKEQWTFSLKSK